MLLPLMVIIAARCHGEVPSNYRPSLQGILPYEATADMSVAATMPEYRIKPK